MEGYFFIVNSRIGSRRMKVIKDLISLHFEDRKYCVHPTEFGGHATTLAKQALKEQYTHVIAVGGDGTVNEIVQVLAHKPVVLAIVPCGSGNGLARHCGIPLNTSQAILNIVDGETISIDLGKVNEVYFVSNAGVGLDATVCHAIKSSQFRGLKMYAYQVMKNYFSYKPETYQIEVDGQPIPNQKGYFLNIANGKEFGYGFEIASGASLTDGLLDLVIVKEMNILKGIRFVWDGWFKRLEKNKNCLFRKGQKIIIQANSMNYFQTDGDAHSCEGICTFVICEKSLQVIIPKHKQI